MKKWIVALLVGVWAAPLLAQTDFRRITHDEALAAAKRENKMVFIDFYTDWCGPCKRMASDVFPQKAVGDYFNAKFVCLKLNAEKEGKEYAGKYEVRAYPTFVVLDCEGKVLYNHAGGSFDGEKFINQIETGINPELSPERMTERYQRGERTAELVQAYAAYLLEKAYENRRPDKEKLAEANRIVDDYFSNLTDEQKVAKENMFVYGMEYAGRPSDPKIKYLVAHRQNVGEGKEAVQEIIGRVYDSELNNFLSGDEAFSSAEVKAFQEEMDALGLNDEGKNKAAFCLLEAYAGGDRNQYVEACEQHFRQLTAMQQQQVFSSYDRLLKGADQAVLGRAVKFMRGQLADLDAVTIYYGSAALMGLEKAMKN